MSPYPKIDKLRKKFDENKPLSLREACWILWAEEGVCSSQYFTFAYWVNKQKFPKGTKVTWSIWKSLFSTFAKEYWPTVRDNTDLMVKIHKTSLDKLMGKK